METNVKSQFQAPMPKPVLSLFIQKFHFREFGSLIIKMLKGNGTSTVNNKDKKTKIIEKKKNSVAF